MSSFEHRVAKPRANARLPRWLCILGMPVIAATFSAQAYAACEYKVDSQWNGGFTATIKITNSTTSTINGWNISWQYTGADRFTNGWNANYTGTHPYSATDMGWNGTLAPNQSVEIGFQGTKTANNAEIAVVTGSVCGSAPVSSASPSSSSSSSSVAAVGQNWDLDTTTSYISFVTVKNKDNVEVHTFDQISGQIDSTGAANVVVNLDSVNTNNSTRNTRVRSFLFETATYPRSTITTTVPEGVISTLQVGQTLETSLTASVDLHGVTKDVVGRVSIQRLSNDRILVQTIQPIITKASDFGMTDGLEYLRGLISASSISTAVSVDFAFLYVAR